MIKRSDYFFADFWKLPQSDLASSVTERVERNFYSRCSPEKRPLHLREELESVNEPPSDDDAKLEKGVVEDAEVSPTPSKRQPVYNESLFGALHQTFLQPLWIAGFLKLFAGTYSLLYRSYLVLIFAQILSKQQHL